jgi:hypothetical protein
MLQTCFKMMLINLPPFWSFVHIIVALIRLARTIYIWCIYGVVGKEITNDTVIYGSVGRETTNCTVINIYIMVLKP